MDQINKQEERTSVTHKDLSYAITFSLSILLFLIFSFLVIQSEILQPVISLLSALSHFYWGLS